RRRDHLGQRPRGLSRATGAARADAVHDHRAAVDELGGRAGEGATRHPHPLLMAPQVAVGDEIPTFERMSSFHHWNRYAAVNHEFVDIHMDDRAGKRAGYPGAFGMGNLQWAYLHCLLRQWAGEEAVISHMSCQFRAPNLNDLRTIARGRVLG